MSSNDVVIRANGLGKRYKIGQLEPYSALRDVITNVVTAPARYMESIVRGQRRSKVAADRFFWALEDVSFEVRAGEVLGLIGANGAGKSTLLKILSRITEPTSGRAELYGRVGSLLEVGTGFHPELTGRENVYLNGSILGMRRAEIERQFDEIVEFSGIDKYLDTPVKRYSSGMQVRLAFAVAAHLQPEILLVDEVLAVGDAQFQQKSLGKMESVTNEGRTVVFVSHNLAAVRRLCPRSLVLERGKLVFDGDTDKAIERYLANEVARSDGVLEGEALAQRRGVTRVYSDRPFFRCERIMVVGDDGQTRTVFRSDEEITLVIDWEVLRDLPHIRIFVEAIDRNEVTLLRTETMDDPLQPELFPFSPGPYRSSVTFPANLFGETTIRLSVYFFSDVLQIDQYEKVFELSVSFTGLNGNMRSGAHMRPQLPWRTEARVDEPARV
jgi:lipopolysaccharide transport system ATP-binding protein